MWRILFNFALVWHIWGIYLQMEHRWSTDGAHMGHRWGIDGAHMEHIWNTVETGCRVPEGSM